METRFQKGNKVKIVKFLGVADAATGEECLVPDKYVNPRASHLNSTGVVKYLLGYGFRGPIFLVLHEDGVEAAYVQDETELIE